MGKTPTFNEDDSVELEELEEDQELKELGDEESEGLGKPKNPEESDNTELESEDEKTGTDEDL